MSSKRSKGEHQDFAGREIVVGVERDMAGDRAGAAQAYRRAMHVLQGLPLGPWVAIALNNLGVIEAEDGNYARARNYLEQAWESSRNTGDVVSELINICNLATVAGAAELVPEAARYRRYALRTRIRLGDRVLTPTGGFLPGNLSRLMGIEAWMEAEDDTLSITPPPLPARTDPNAVAVPVSLLSSDGGD